MSQPQTDSVPDRRCQILDAALVCFAKRGFHQTSMHDISAEAGISVGLIYRYFENKEAVISAMADRHKREIPEVLQRAKQAPTLLESLEILFTAHCCEEERQWSPHSLWTSIRKRHEILRSPIWCATFGNRDGRRNRIDQQSAGGSKHDTRPFANRNGRVNFRRRTRYVDARCAASAGNDRDGAAGATIASDAQTMELFIQTGGRTRLCMM